MAERNEGALIKKSRLLIAGGILIWLVLAIEGESGDLGFFARRNGVVLDGAVEVGRLGCKFVGTFSGGAFDTGARILLV